jgi:hypothetical protein
MPKLPLNGKTKQVIPAAESPKREAVEKSEECQSEEDSIPAIGREAKRSSGYCQAMGNLK